MMKNVGSLLLLTLVSTSMVVAGSGGHVLNPSPSPIDPIEPTITIDLPSDPTEPVPASLHDQLRELWVEHNVWSRAVLVGVFESLPGCESYENRVQTNVTQLKDALGAYLTGGADKFGYLYTRNLELENQILYDIKAGDTSYLDLLPEWYSNAELMSNLLCSINTRWNCGDMNLLWRQHLDASLEQASAYKDGDPDREIAAFDRLQKQSMRLADYLSQGLTP